MTKRCFTLIRCPLESKCELAHIDPKHGQFQPEYVGDACHCFKPLIMQPEEMFKYQWAIE